MSIGVFSLFKHKIITAQFILFFLFRYCHHHFSQYFNHPFILLCVRSKRKRKFSRFEGRSIGICQLAIYSNYFCFFFWNFLTLWKLKIKKKVFFIESGKYTWDRNVLNLYVGSVDLTHRKGIVHKIQSDTNSYVDFWNLIFLIHFSTLNLFLCLNICTIQDRFFLDAHTTEAVH